MTSNNTSSSSTKVPPYDAQRQSREEDDCSAWETLEVLGSDSSSSAHAVTDQPQSTPTSRNDDSSLVRSSSQRIQQQAQPSSSTSSSSRLPPRIQAIQRRLETRARLKQGLVEHPMKMLWSHFIVHFGRELWELDLQIRIALLFIITGATLNMIILSTWYLWYPRLVMAAMVVLLSMFYLYPNAIQNGIEGLLLAVSCPLQFADSLGQQQLVDPAQLRRVAVAAIFVLPTLLEMQTILFLSQINKASGWWSTYYNICVTALILVVMLYLRYNNSSNRQGCRECIQKGLVLLYGSALLVTLVRLDVLRIPILAAPFLLATGVLIVTSRNDGTEWFSRAVRHALRLSLRDVLETVSTSVKQDEMLQLAMLRWIVDYWANRPDVSAAAPEARPARTSTATTGSTTRQEGSSNTGSAGAGTPSFSASNATAVDSSGTTPCENRVIHRAPPLQVGSTSIASPPPELQWDELWSMLSMTTEQMACEVTLLQHASVPPERPAQGPIPPSPSLQQSSSPNSFDSVMNLQSMLSSMDIDDRAKPAVMAYKRGVQAFPPTRNMAIFLSVARRCPAVLALLWQVTMFGPSGSLSSTAILLPFVLFEMLRVQSWSKACQRAAARGNTPTVDVTQADDGDGIFSFRDLDSMTIVLSGDTFSVRKPPSLLAVWRNIIDSVSALEVGLTAARCAQTTAVAVDFAGNIMSLAQFGVEVSQKGWIHGLSVVVKELLILHTAHTTAQSSTPGPRNVAGTKYTAAAVGAVRNSQRVSHNVRVLMEEEDAGRVLRPLMGFLPVLFGHGWLWGKDGPHNTPSTVEITEIEESGEGLLQTDKPSIERVYSASVRSVALDDADAANTVQDPANGRGSIAMNGRSIALADAGQVGTAEEYESGRSSITATAPTEHLLAADANDNGHGFVTASIRSIALADAVGTAEESESGRGSITAPSPQPSHSESGELLDLSQIMELIAACDEAGLLSEEDKNSFCEKLALVGSVQSPSEDWLDASSRTLRGLLEMHTEEAGIADGQSYKETPPDPVVRLQEGPGPTEKQPYRVTTPPVCRLIVEDDDDSDFEPLDVMVQGTASRGERDLSSKDQRTAHSKEVGGTSATPPVESKPSQSENEEENLWLKVGGGIAVLGAVVGGVALAMGQQGNDDQNQTRRRRQTNSSVVIEEVEDGNEWVSVPKDRSDRE